MAHWTSRSRRGLRAALAAAIAGGFLVSISIPSLHAAALSTGSALTSGSSGTSSGSSSTSTTGGSTWKVTEQYSGPGALVTSCPPNLVGGPVPTTTVGGGCFGLDHPYIDVASITVADQAAPNVDGDWELVDPSQNVLASGPVCNGSAQQLPPTIPAGASTLFVFVGNPVDAVASCGGAGSPVATSGTVTATFDIPAGSMANPIFPVSCPGGISSGHVMPFLTGAPASLQPPPQTLPCGVPWPPPPAGQPSPVNMAYFGGHVQVDPQSYLVLWGWNSPAAFRDPATGSNPASDPQGAAARMQAFLGALGGTNWAGVQTQYYETSGGTNINITNPKNQLAGVWSDDTDPIHDNLSQLDLAQEAQRAAIHFGILNADGSVANPTALLNSNFVIAQPQDYNDAGFSGGVGYCAWHDYTEPSPYPYSGVTPGISFTSMPYVLNEGASCGQNVVNSGAAGTLDGVTIVLGHEEEETVTDPGAEDTVNGQTIGGWYDYSSYENGDKCAWVGDTPAGLVPIPGAVGTMTGNDGNVYPVQSLWSNNAAAGVGYCAGTNNDLPF